MTLLALRTISWALIVVTGFSGAAEVSMHQAASLLSPTTTVEGDMIQNSSLLAKLPKHCKKLKTPKPKKATKKSKDMCWCTPGGPVACSQIDKKKTKKKKSKKSEVLQMFASPFPEYEVL
jgi:hypothetical protein